MKSAVKKPEILNIYEILKREILTLVMRRNYMPNITNNKKAFLVFH
ncbi:unknown [[Mannheimia] succiniciproducens MBEL55E]|uniref:Uncharacterized protein n=1 Tax=Mannheimia succiniciproducens (strain KCTC 0769BP / MBEL55E) TaxID=221988 RepID=Q65TY8_MANSM|nr:unknown [[Mannheimia] succiniciproducens MBEL55E]